MARIHQARKPIVFTPSDNSDHSDYSDYSDYSDHSDNSDYSDYSDYSDKNHGYSSKKYRHSLRVE